jgi:hypothetical protein
MKHVPLILGLSLITTSLFALDCGNLGLTITNNTGATCELKNTIFLYGYYSGGIPRSLPNGATSDTFYITQDNNGIGLELDYRCDNKVVIFLSQQAYCGIYAGSIYASTYGGNDLNAEYRAQEGSYWYGLPGQITWNIHQ